MANNVSVTFSAQIGQLISGVDQVKEAIASIAAPVNAMVSVFSGFGEAFAGAFAINQVAEFVSQMEDLGTKTVRTAAMLGVSTTEAQQLSFIAKATGGDAESLALSMERLQVNLQKAQSGAGPAAQALQALGLSAKSLIGLPLEEQMNRIADAVSKFADGGNKTAIVMDLLGRNGAQMIPVLDKGRGGLEELRDSALAAGVVMSKETVDGLDRAGTAAVTLRASITGLGEAIVGSFSKQLTEAANSLTTFAADMAALVQTGHLAEAAIAELGAGVRIAGANIASLAQTVVYAITGQWGEAVKAWRAGSAEILRIQKETDDQLLLQAAKLRLALGMNLKFGGGGGAPTDKPQAPPMEVPNKDALSAQMEQYQSQIKLADEAFKQTQEQLASAVKLHQISYDQETQELLAALDKRHAAEDTATIREMALYAEGTAGYVKALDERKLKDAEYYAERQKLLDAAKQKDVAEWQSMLQPVMAAFNSQLRGLLSGTETWSQAMKKIFGDLVMDIIKKLETIAVEDAALGLFNLFGGGIGSLFGGGGGGGGGGKGGIPSFDVGSWSVPANMLALVHQNEMIVPAQGGVADSMRSMFTGGGGSGSGGPTIVMQGTMVGNQQWFNQNLQQLARLLAGYNARTPSSSFE